MANVSISVDTRKLSRYLQTRPAEMRAAIHRIIEGGILLIERESKIKTPVDTGRLRASIGGGVYAGGSFQEGEGIEIKELTASIGPTVNYAKYVHKYRPFMFQGTKAAVPNLKKLVSKEIEKAIKD